ncbi:hypothetical protein LINPERHAP1_LOCUS32710 [Linum perenne]
MSRIDWEDMENFSVILVISGFFLIFLIIQNSVLLFLYLCQSVSFEYLLNFVMDRVSGYSECSNRVVYSLSHSPRI